MRPLSILLDLGRRLRDRASPGARILLYHRVNALSSDPQWLSLAPDRFDQHLQILSQEADVVPLEELHRRSRGAPLPRRTVAITFDDGYADNLLQAAPILARHGLPATIFVSSSGTRQERELYWDELDRLLLDQHALPERFSLALMAAEHSFDLGAEGNRPPAPDGWNATRPPATRRQRAYLQLCALLGPLEDGARQQALERLRLALARPREVRLFNRMLDPDQLRLLAAAPGISIGAHTVTHPILSQLPAQAQEAEIEGGRRELQALLGKPVTSFAYPFGGRGDFNALSQRLVRKAGFELACANYPGVVRRGVDSFALPRVLVRDWPAVVFRARLLRWLGG